MCNIEKLKELLNEGENLLNIEKPNNSIIADAPRLDSRKTQEWKLKTLTCLKNTIGTEDELYLEFKENTKNAYKHNIKKAVSTLKIIIETLESNPIPKNTPNDEIIESNPIPKNNTSNDEIIETILNRFHKVVVELKELDLEIQKESDVKKLLKALLGIYYENIKAEEPVESYADIGSQIDLYIKDINYGIEIKLAKNSIQQRQIVEQINDDIQKYQKLPNCEKIYFFIYNPDFLIKNHASFDDLPSKAGNIEITTIVTPKL